MNGNGREIRLIGIVERDANEERNGRSNEQSEMKQPINGNDSNNRSSEPGLIRYVYEGVESTIQYTTTNLSNTSALFCGDKVMNSFVWNASHPRCLLG